MNCYAMDVPVNLTDVFAFVHGRWMRKLALREHFGFRSGSIAVLPQSALCCPACICGAKSKIEGVAAELLEQLIFGADVSVAGRRQF